MYCRHETYSVNKKAQVLSTSPNDLNIRLLILPSCCIFSSLHAYTYLDSSIILFQVLSRPIKANITFFNMSQISAELIRSRDLWLQEAKEKYGTPGIAKSNVQGKKRKYLEPEPPLRIDDFSKDNKSDIVSSPIWLCVTPSDNRRPLTPHPKP